MAKRRSSYDYDLIAIGSGAGGGVAAHIAARDGKKVAIVESDTIGGECPNFGCTPTKALLTAADSYRTIREAAGFGIKVGTIDIDYKKVKAWKDLVVRRTGTGLGDRAYEAEGITVIRGHAHFLDSHTISINKHRFSARYFLVATGTHNFVPPIEGLKETGFLTHRELVDFTHLPRSIFIIGGGPIGCEFGYLLSTFGTKVVIVEAAPKLIFREDPEVGDFTEGYFKQLGIQVLTSTTVTKVESKRGKKVVHFSKGTRHGIAVVDEILLAAGMHPNTDLGLENAKVKYSNHGITVNTTMRTSAKNIYAAGDVAGPYAFTHMASYQSRVAVHNMFKKHTLIAKYHAVPRVIYTEPEIATVGMTEDQLQRQEIHYKVNMVPISIIGRSNVTNKDQGFVKVIVSKTDVLLGAVIVSPRAGEVIHELALAVNLGLTAQDVANTIHAFPTWSEAVRAACAGIK